MRSVPWLASITLHALLFLAISQVSRPPIHPTRQLQLDFRILHAQPSPDESAAVTAQPEHVRDIDHSPTRKIHQLPEQKPVRTVPTKKAKAEPLKVEDVVVKQADRLEADITTSLVSDSVTETSATQPQALETSVQMSATAREELRLQGEAAAVAMKRRLIGQARNRVLGKLTYPSLARRKGWGGELILGFVWCSDGTVEDLRVVESSGYGLLDRAAIQAVQAAVPFDQGHPRITVRLPINFKLE